jgi:hypothetical protein
MMSGNLWDSTEMKPISGKYRVVRIGGVAVAGGGDDVESSADAENGKGTSSKAKKAKVAATADKKVVLGAIAAPVVVAVTAKPKWREKLESTKIVATWKKEYLAAVKGTVPESSAEKLFNAAMELLKKMAEGKDDGGDGSDDESMLSYDAQLTGWALDVSRDADGLGLPCSCHPTCTMCFQGRWPDVDDEDAMDPEYNDAVKEYTGPKNVKSFVAWLKTRCKCLPDCEARLKAIWREYLEKYTRCEMNLVPEELRSSLLALVAPMEKVPASELDWHPGSNEQVLELVHPSLYCNVRGLTKVTGGGNAEEVTSRRGAAKRVGESSENDEGDASNSCEKHDPPVPQEGRDWVKVHYGFEVREVGGERAFGGQAPLGSITTKQGLCLFFPNCFQHKIGPMKLIDPTKPGVRKILVFFLVDYRKGAKDRIPSTSDITNQRHDGTMTLLEAKGFRELLMHERKFLVKDEDAFFERMFSLCEH